MDNKNKIQVLFFLWGSKEFGIEIKDIQEILKLERTQPVPLAPSFLNCITNVRGKVVSVFYLNRLFKIKSEPNGSEARAMVLEDKELQVGIYADSISNIEFLDPSCLNPAPEPMLQKNIKAFVKGELEVRARESRVLLLDSEAAIKFLKKMHFKQRS